MPITITDNHDVLFDLANTRPTDESVRWFCKDWGMPVFRDETDFEVFCRLSEELWGYLHLLSSGRVDELEVLLAGQSIDAGRVTFEANGASTYREPRSLSEFCYLHLAMLIEDKVEVLRCLRPGCDGFYRRRRSTRQFCSNACRNAIYKHRRRRRRSNTKEDELDVVEHARIAAMWAARNDLYIVPDRGRAYVSAAMADELDPEFANEVIAWMEGSDL